MTPFPGASTAITGILHMPLIFFLLSCHLVYFLFLLNQPLDIVQWDIPFLWNGHGVPRPDDKSVCDVGNL